MGAIKRGKRFFAGAVMALVLLSALAARPATVSAAGSSEPNRMNVVFVIDKSGSMGNTDDEGFRYDALKLFLSLSAETGNYMGAVVFNQKIALQEEVGLVEGMEGKDRLYTQIWKAGVGGDTNIGEAVETAVEMLQQSGNPALPSAIILLSDGNTDLPGAGKDALQASYDSRANAIDMARANGYKIHSVCLNANGAADPAELREISAATGGTSVEVASAEDLKDVFTQFYSIIYPALPFELADVTLPENGEAEISFNIPRIGVEEANIIINTINPATSYMLYQPSGIAFTEEELNGMRVTANTFSVLKIQDPEAGSWKLAIRGTPGDNVKIEMLYNSDLTIAQTVNSGNPVFADADTLISAQLSNAGNPVTDESIYRDYPFHVVISDGSGTADEVMAANGPQAEYTYRLAAGVEYEISTYCQIDGLTVKSEPVKVRADRTFPMSKEIPIKITMAILPFGKSDHAFNLGEVISDSVDTVLSYRISKSDFDDSQVSVDGEVLNIKIKEIGKGGQLYVTAENSAGGFIDVQVILKTVNLIPLILAGLAVAALAAAGVVLLALKKKASVPINGKIQIRVFNNDDGTKGSPVFRHGEKGRMSLSANWTIPGSIGIDMQGTYFVHGESDSYIYLVSKKGFYTEDDQKTRNQKIRLKSDIEVMVSSKSDLEKGIYVMYIADNRNNF